MGGKRRQGKLLKKKKKQVVPILQKKRIKSFEIKLDGKFIRIPKTFVKLDLLDRNPFLRVRGFEILGLYFGDIGFYFDTKESYTRKSNLDMDNSTDNDLDFESYSRNKYVPFSFTSMIESRNRLNISKFRYDGRTNNQLDLVRYGFNNNDDNPTISKFICYSYILSHEFAKRVVNFRITPEKMKEQGLVALANDKNYELLLTLNPNLERFLK